MKLFASTVQPKELFSHYHPTGLIGRFFNFPLFRVFVILIFFAPIMALNSVIVFQVIDNLQEPVATYVDIIRMLITIPLFILSYRFYCQIFEKREAVEMNFQGALQQWAAGAAVASIMILTFVLMIALIGEFKILEVRPIYELVANFLKFSIGSLFQDVILLCIVYRLIEELTGSWLALLLSLLIFAGVHLGNENESLASIFMLVVSSIIIIAPFILTRRIWLSWGFHAGWNFMQAGIFGMANSGITFKGWLITELSGPEWVTGGAVGLEATYHSMLIDFVMGVMLLVMAYKTGKIVKPNWKFSRIEQAIAS